VVDERFTGFGNNDLNLLDVIFYEVCFTVATNSRVTGIEFAVELLQLGLLTED
jgi:hypothetical protein